MQNRLPYSTFYNHNIRNAKLWPIKYNGFADKHLIYTLYIIQYCRQSILYDVNHRSMLSTEGRLLSVHTTEQRNRIERGFIFVAGSSMGVLRNERSLLHTCTVQYSHKISLQKIGFQGFFSATFLPVSLIFGAESAALFPGR
jgi:hypothetical protein